MSTSPICYTEGDDNTNVCFDLRELESMVFGAGTGALLTFRSGQTINCSKWTWERQGKQVLKLWQKYNKDPDE